MGWRKMAQRVKVLGTKPEPGFDAWDLHGGKRKPALVNCTDSTCILCGIQGSTLERNERNKQNPKPAP